MLHAMARAGEVTVLMITHKFREVMAFADAVSVLRRGRLAGEGRVAELTPARRQVIHLPPVAAGPVPEDPPRARPRHHAAADDGDEPMPPSIDLDP